MSQLKLALKEIDFARNYTLSLLDDIPQDQWLAMPGGVPTHIAWQVGHLAMAEHRLALMRVRGERPDDEQLIPSEFVTRYGKDSVADPAAENNIPLDDIRATFDRVHRRTLEELATFSEDRLSEPLEAPHPMVDNKLDVLWYAAQHEMVHAGQIGLVRRMLGKPPVR